MYLLHGALDDYTMWLRHTNIERYAEAAGIAVVMPSGQNGFYSNALYGLRYFDYITEELPRMIEYTFPVSTDRKDRFIAQRQDRQHQILPVHQHEERTGACSPHPMKQINP